MKWTLLLPACRLSAGRRCTAHFPAPCNAPRGAGAATESAFDRPHAQDGALAIAAGRGSVYERYSMF